MPGLYFEELTVGRVFVHAMRRTVTEADNVFFSALTMNSAALHLDEQYCKEHTEFGTRIVNSAFTLGLVVGISVGDTTLGTTVGQPGLGRSALSRNRCSTATRSTSKAKCVEARESRSRPDNGIVVFAHRGYNQRNELV